MLQPRRYKLKGGMIATCLLFLVFIHSVLGTEKEAYRDKKDESEFQNLEVKINLSRVKRDNSGLTTVLLISNEDENRYGKSARPSGVLTSTARTFVHDGTTTEYGTQVIGTTLDQGKYYAQILQTSSRIYFGSQEKSSTKTKLDERAFYKSRFIGLPQNVENFIHSSVFQYIQPSEPVFIYSTKGVNAVPAVKIGNGDGKTSDSSIQFEESVSKENGESGRVDGNSSSSSSSSSSISTSSSSSSSTSSGNRGSSNGKEIFISQITPFSSRSKDNGDTDLLENLIRLENIDVFNKRKVGEIKTNRASPNQLPTYTIRHDFAPSGFSVSSEDEKEERVAKNEKSKFRSGKGLFNKPAEIKYDTVTYLGFADFVTTVGSTVIVFMPTTRSGSQPVTQSLLPQTSASQKADAQLQTTIKTFLSHGQGMVTQTVPGHSLSMETVLPTSVADRKSKGLGEDLELKSSVLAKEQILFENPVFTSELDSTDILIEPSETMTYSSISRTSQAPTEPLATFATTVTRTFGSGGGEKPLGLLKSIGGTKAYNGTTTHFTSLIYGTYVDGSYAQVLKTSSSVYYIIEDGGGISATVVLDKPSKESKELKTDMPFTTDAPTTTDEIKTATEGEDELLETSDTDYEDEDKTTEGVTTEAVTDAGEINKARKIDFHAKEQTVTGEDGDKGAKKNQTREKVEAYQTQTSEELITRLVPSTVYKTFTYLTTFFIPADETTTTSIRSREVVTSDVNLVTKIINPNVVSEENFQTSSLSVLTESNIVDESNADEEFRLPVVRLLAPETAVVIEDTTDEDIPNETITTAPATTFAATTEEFITEDTLKEGLSTLQTTPGTESTDGDTTLFESTTEASTLPITSTPNTTDAATTTAKDLEETDEKTKFSKVENKTVANDESDDEEVEVIFKTLFTTYTYLTTFFHESTTSISSSEVVVTNVITSTLDVPGEKSSKQVLRTTPVQKEAIKATRIPSKNIFENDDGNDEFLPTSVINGGSETKFFDDEDDEDEFVLSASKEISGGSVTQTPALELKNLKTLYTTYTYFTTLVDDGSTEVQSRTEVVTNVVGPNSVSVLPSSILQNEALLKSKFEMLLREQQSLRGSILSTGASSSTVTKPSAKSSSFYTTFNPSSTAHRFSASSSTQPSSNLISSRLRVDGSSRLTSSTRGTSFQRFSIRPSASVKTRFVPFTRRFNEQGTRANNGESFLNENEEDNSVTRLIIKGDKKDRTVIRKRIRTKARPLPKSVDVDDNLGITTIRLDPSPTDEDSIPQETMVTDVRSSSSKGGRQIRVAPPEPIERIGEEFYDDQISSESNTDEIQPSPTLVLQTSYTTFTYFTTVYKGASSSDVISRLETITNIVTETAKPEYLATQSLSPEDATLPITYFTTFTYWTTLYKDGNTVITSREETVSNVVTPTVEPSSTSIVDKTMTPNSETFGSSLNPSSSSTSTSSIFIPAFIPAVTPEPVTEPAEAESQSPIEVENPVENVTQVLVSTEGLIGKQEPTTYYTTYTYFTTSYVGDSTVLKSRLETVTSVVVPTPTISEITENDLQTGRSINSGSGNVVSKSEEKENSENPFQTGLLSTVVSTAVENGKTTLYSTDIFGTFIDGLYAKVLESTTKVISSSDVTPSLSSEIQKTGIVSINEGRIVDADGISTTFFTTKAIGTSIEQLYAQVVESTTSVLVDNDKKSALASLSETQVEDSQRTGLLLLTEGSIIQDGTTTLYESRLIGTIVDGSYVQVVESTSSYKIEPSIAPSLTIHSEVTPTTTVTLTSPSPSAVEGSIVDDVKSHEDEQEETYEDEEEDGDEEGNKGRVRSRLTFQSKKRTFTPVIRPFASRNRPTFLPKKKPLGTTGAQTITRANFTPTITATLATKTEGFIGSSRNRFGGSRKSSGSVLSAEVKPTLANSRKFGRNRSSFSSPTLSSSFAPTRGRGSSARVSPTPTLNLNSARSRANFRTSSRGFNFESGAVRPSLPGTRPRIRPTLSGLPGRSQGSATATTNLPNDKVNDLTTVLTEDEEGSFTSEDDGVTLVTTTPTTTTEDPNLARRNNNPLLRFRRPLLPKASTTTTTPKPATTSAPRRGILGGRNNRLPASPPNTTPRNVGRTPVNIGRNTLPNRSRPVNNLFPPRGLFKKPTPQEAEKEEDEFLDEEEDTDIEDEDNNFEETAAKEVEADVEVNTNERNVKGRGFNPVQIRPFNFQRRSKRQAVEYGTRKLSSDSSSYRYRRPKAKPAQAQERIDYYDDEIVPSEPPKTSRTVRIYTPRTRGQTYQAQTTNPPVQSRIRPTTASSQNSPRAPFTIREKDSSTNPRTSNFRRGQNSSSRRKATTYKGTEPTVTRKTSRARGQSQNQALNDLTRGSQRRGYSNSRRVSSTRGRPRFGESEDPFTYQPSAFDGTITVTHKIPSEVTIPIVSGKVTEYRNVITAKPSIEILGPHQYTVTSTNGGTILYLNREVTETLNNGVTEVTKFLIHETPTTSIIFTPTTIRGRKTSFSHIIPSTVYDVENIVTTIQPQIAANAPLANILLSQLLLGNLNVPVPPNQPLGIPQPPLTPTTPTTEYKTRTTTYVTSVTDQISTVLPITFRGKEILTTIVDNTVNVITATEYITDTIVVTPTLNPNQQINSLLLPALLQAQLLNSNQQVTPPQLPIPGFTQLPFTPSLGLDPLKFEALQPQDIKIEDLTDDKAKLSRDNDIRLERESDTEGIEEEMDDVKLSHKLKSRKKTDKKRLEPEPAKEIITLYVSGRRPGEFSTILSTVTTGETSVAVRKREAATDEIDRLVVEASEAKQVQVLASKQLTLDEERHNQKDQEPSYLDLYVTPGMPEVVIPVESQEINSETQSLESVLGDVSKHVTESAKATPVTRAFVTPTRNDYQKDSKKSSTKRSVPKTPKENY